MMICPDATKSSRSSMVSFPAASTGSKSRFKSWKAGKFHVVSNATEMEEYLQVLRFDMVKILKDNKKIILE